MYVEEPVMSIKARVYLSPFLLLLISALGCGNGGEDLPDVVPVTGSVTLNGEPLPGASVTFMGEGRPCYGATDDNGTFTIKDMNGREGCPVGKYKVIISKYTKPDGSPLGDSPEEAAQGVEQLPPQYSSMDKSTLTANVPEGGKTFDFSLEDKRKKK